MNELDVRIAVWKCDVQERVGANVAGELEDHLRTTMEALEPTGLPADEKFLIAAHRLGHPDALSAEFAKNDPFAVWRCRLAWMLIGLVPVHLALGAVTSVGVRIGSMSVTWGIPLWAAAAAELIGRALFLAVIVAVCLWAGKAWRPVAGRRPRWWPTSFAGLAGLLAAATVIFYLEPVILSGYQGWATSSQIGLENLHTLMYAYQLSQSWLDLAFYLSSAVLIAWLVARRTESYAAPA